MSRRSPLLVALAALLALARVWLGPGPERLGAPAPAVAAAAESACGGEACGCSHAELADCCCAPSAASPESHARAPREESRAPEFRAPSSGQAAPVPATTLSAAHCGGTPRGQASFASAPPAVSCAAAALALRDAPRARVVLTERGPLYEVDREPPTPPPRG